MRPSTSMRWTNGTGSHHGLRVGLSLRTDWLAANGRSAGFDIAPRLGGASLVILNDLGLLETPQAADAPGIGAVGGDPRLASSDIVVRVSSTGQIEAPSTGAVLRRIAAQPRTGGGAA